MPGQPTPPLIQEPFGKNAAAPYIQKTIPLTTADPERASFDLGFPPQTMTELLAGGTPPFGQDVNGILYMISAHTAAAEAGQPYLFNNTLSTAMGGYAVGCVVGMADGTGLWINTVNGNVTDPDGGSAAGWMPLYSYGFVNVPVSPGGVVVLTPAQYRRNFIALSGNISGNVQVIFPSGVIGQRSWLIVNGTAGGFTVTAKTAGGNGVEIPPGGFSSPVGVYGEGANIFPLVAPLNLAISQDPVPNTVVQRTNGGYVFATYFNSNNPNENFAIDGIYATAGDGYHRRISPTNFAAQIALSAFAGAVVPAQVPLSAVIQYVANILSNAALTGTPTAPTAGVGNNTTVVASTAFAYAQAGGGQTYTDQTANRALGTPYTNTSGRAIKVSFQGGVSTNGSVQATVGGVACGGYSLGAAAFNHCMYFEVPPGGVYQITRTSGSSASYTWTELA